MERSAHHSSILNVRLENILPVPRLQNRLQKIKSIFRLGAGTGGRFGMAINAGVPNAEEPTLLRGAALALCSFGAGTSSFVFPSNSVKFV